jgi:hypothetical protein
VLEQWNEFSVFTDTALSSRAIDLQTFYQSGFESKKSMFYDCLLKIVTKKVHELSY